MRARVSQIREISPFCPFSIFFSLFSFPLFLFARSARVRSKSFLRRSLIFPMTESITRPDARRTNKSASEGFRKMKYRQCWKTFSDLNFHPFSLSFLCLFFFLFFLFLLVLVAMFSQDFIFLRSFERVSRFQFACYVQTYVPLLCSVVTKREEGINRCYCWWWRGSGLPVFYIEATTCIAWKLRILLTRCKVVASLLTITNSLD